MGRFQQWIHERSMRAGPALATLALLALSIVLAACGKGGGSGY